MNAQEFCYWLQGPAELDPGWVPSPEQWKSIKEHLQTVFVKVTPEYRPSIGIRTTDLRSPYRALDLMRDTNFDWPGPGGAPVITC